MHRLRIGLAEVGALLIALSAARAAADATSCAASHAAGQREVKAGHLQAALELFNACGADQDCPAAVRNECVTLFDSVDAVLPTLVFSVIDEEGNDITNVRVFSSGERVLDGLDGRPLPVDPGTHGFLFELPSGSMLTTDVLVRQGEKNRIIVLQAPAAELSVPRVPLAAVVEPAEPPELDEPAVPSGVWVASGVSVAALASWGIAGLLGRAKQVELVRCSPRCDASLRGEYDKMQREYRIADASLGVAAVSALTAAALFVVARRNRVTGPEHAGATRARPSFAIAPLIFGRAGGLIALERAY